MKLQSAMEYLMTYGWSILIIVIVLAAFTFLGVFNSIAFSPKANPGNCQVVRPLGVGTTTEMGLSGTCNNQIPKYVATFSQSPAGYVHASQSISSNSAQQITISFWIDPKNNGLWGASGNYWEGAVSGGNGVGCWGNFYFFIESGGSPPSESWSITGGASSARDFPGKKLIPNTWQQLAATYNGVDLAVYYNGALIPSSVVACSNCLGDYPYLTISGNNPTSNGGGCNPISGGMANVQIYGKSLSSTTINALYKEGIGGVPINIQSLIAWYPLNGDTNDYSGNQDNGVQNNVTFISNWYNDYTSP
jgi:hypothetical protein